MSEAIKAAIKRFSHALGLEIRKYRSPPKNPLVQWKVDLLLDVGANVGQYAKKARSEGYVGRILSFEPLPDAYEKLKESSSQDAFWTVHERCAIGSRDEQVEINISKNSYSSSILSIKNAHLDAAPESVYIGTAKTPVFTLEKAASECVELSNRPFLKIDTQGYEAEVLAGAEGILSRMVAIQLELSIVPLYNGQMLFRYFLDLLYERGFELWSIVPGFTNQATGQSLQFDGIFVRRELLEAREEG